MRRTRRNRPRIASPIVAGLLVCAAAAFSVPELDRMPIRTVQIHGELHHLTREELQALVMPFTSWGWLRLPVERLRGRLEELDWVASAEVRRAWPLDLSIVITERKAVARWGDGALLDESGKPFDPGVELDHILPLLAGPEGSEQEMLEKYRTFSARLDARSRALDKLSLDARGDWRLDLRNGPQLRLGADFIDLRLRRALLALNQLTGEPGTEIAYMDLRYPNGFAMAWRNPAAAGHGGRSP